MFLWYLIKLFSSSNITSKFILTYTLGYNNSIEVKNLKQENSRDTFAISSQVQLKKQGKCHLVPKKKVFRKRNLILIKKRFIYKYKEEIFKVPVWRIKFLKLHPFLAFFW